MTLEILHYIEKLIINLWPLCELNLHSIEVAECVGDIEGSAHFWGKCWLWRLWEWCSGLGSVRFHVWKESEIERKSREGMGDREWEGKGSRGRVEERK